METENLKIWNFPHDRKPRNRKLKNKFSDTCPDKQGPGKTNTQHTQIQAKILKKVIFLTLNYFFNIR